MSDTEFLVLNLLTFLAETQHDHGVFYFSCPLSLSVILVLFICFQVVESSCTLSRSFQSPYPLHVSPGFLYIFTSNNQNLIFFFRDCLQANGTHFAYRLREAKENLRRA